jgi:hypothetical protein
VTNVMNEVVTPTSIAQALESDLRAGIPQRRSIDARSLVASPAMPASVASFLELQLIDGTSTSITTVTKSVTPVVEVGEGGTKPTAATIATESVTLSKFAGRASFSLEASRSSAGLEAAVYYALAAQALSAFESAAVQAIWSGAGTGTSYEAGKITEAIFTEMGHVMAAGGRPSLLIVNPVDLATLGSTFLTSDPGTGIAAGRFAGAAVHVTSAIPAGDAVILDPAGVACLWQTDSPMILVDPYSASATNQISVVVDLLAAAVVSNPDLLGAVSPSFSK